MKTLRVFAIIGLFFVYTATLFGMFLTPQLVPIERLLASAESYRAANPTSAEAHYILARIHYLAFAQSSHEVRAFGAGGDFQAIPRLAPNWMIGPAQQDRWNSTNALPDEEVVSHVIEALSGFREAIRLESKSITAPSSAAIAKSYSAPTNGLYQLGLASLMEQFADWKDMKPSRLPTELRPITRPGTNFMPTVTIADLRQIDHEQARDAYLMAFRSAYPADSLLQNMPTAGIASLVSYESGNAFLRLAEKYPGAGQSAIQLAKAITEVKAGVAKVSALHRNSVTPMIFSMQAVDSIQSLLAPKTEVNFDLRGYGPQDRWSWIKPETALLVWDPERRGEIESARQLFGGYTFEIFRADGYAALAALDDNLDGILSGAELTGIRAWFDLNGNGRSDPGEVRDLDELGIVAIDVRAVTKDGQHPTNPRGLILKDGRTLPTWDWMVEPLKPLQVSRGLRRLADPR